MLFVAIDDDDVTTVVVCSVFYIYPLKEKHDSQELTVETI